MNLAKKFVKITRKYISALVAQSWVFAFLQNDSTALINMVINVGRHTFPVVSDVNEDDRKRMTGMDRADSVWRGSSSDVMFPYHSYIADISLTDKKNHKHADGRSYSGISGSLR